MLLKLDAVRIVEDQHGMHAVRADDLLLADEVILSADLPQRFLFDLRRKGGDILPGGEDPLGNIVHEGYGAAVEHDDTLVDKGGCGAKIAKVLLFLPADGENTESLIDRTLQSELASLGGKDWVVDLSADALSQRAAADCGIIYATDAFSAGLTVVGSATAEMCGQVIYPAAVLKGDKEDAARAFLAYLQTDAAMTVFESVGFSPAI